MENNTLLLDGARASTEVVCKRNEDEDKRKKETSEERGGTKKPTKGEKREAEESHKIKDTQGRCIICEKRDIGTTPVLDRFYCNEWCLKTKVHKHCLVKYFKKHKQVKEVEYSCGKCSKQFLFNRKECLSSVRDEHLEGEGEESETDSEDEKNSEEEKGASFRDEVMELYTTMKTLTKWETVLFLYRKTLSFVRFMFLYFILLGYPLKALFLMKMNWEVFLKIGAWKFFTEYEFSQQWYVYYKYVHLLGEALKEDVQPFKFYYLDYPHFVTVLKAYVVAGLLWLCMLKPARALVSKSTTLLKTLNDNIKNEPNKPKSKRSSLRRKRGKRNN